MKVRFETVFRAGMVFLLMALAWSVWAAAESGTNAPAAATTNHAPGWVHGLEQFDQRYLTFGLDQVEVLRSYYFLGEPLWKYAASLVYILLAFGVTKLIDLAAFTWLKLKNTQSLKSLGGGGPRKRSNQQHFSSNSEARFEHTRPQ